MTFSLGQVGSSYDQEKSTLRVRLMINQLLTSDNTLLSESTTTALTASLPSLASFLEASLAANTRRAYRGDVAHFMNWGGSIPTTPEVVAKYLAQHAGRLTVATLSRRTVAIGKAHVMAGLANPTTSELVKLTIRGIRRTCGQPQRQAAAAIKEDVLEMVSRINNSVKGRRDRALLLLGFAGAFRRSELVGLNVSDIQHVPQGVVIHLRRSKTDQEGTGRKVGIPFARGAACPVRALTAWLATSGVTDGPVFRPVSRHGHVSPARLSGEAVAVIIKECARAQGLDHSRYSGHSLRAGFATSAAAAGVAAWKIRQQTGHASDTMLSRYIRNGELFRDNAAGYLL